MSLLRVAPLRLRPASLTLTHLARRSVLTESYAAGRPESEGPLYKAPPKGKTAPSAAAEGPKSAAKPRDPKSKNAKVTGGKNFGDLKKMHTEGRD